MDYQEEPQGVKGGREGLRRGRRGIWHLGTFFTLFNQASLNPTRHVVSANWKGAGL